MTDSLIDDLREQMRQATAHDAPRPDLAERVHRANHRRHRRGVLVVSTGLALVAVGGAVALVQVDGSRSARGEVLSPASPAPATSPWWAVTEMTVQTSTDGSGSVGDTATPSVTRWRHPDGRQVYPTYDTLGSPPKLIEVDNAQQVYGAPLSYDQIQRLPTDLAALKVALLSAPEEPVPGISFDGDVSLTLFLKNVLLNAPTPAPARAALVALIRGLPEVSEQPDVDALGRPGLRLTIPRDERTAEQIVVDLESDRLLESRLINVGRPDSSRVTYTVIGAQDPPAPFAD